MARNTDGLIRNSDLTHEELSAMAKKGAKKRANNIARRKKLKEELEIALTIGSTQHQVCAAIIEQAKKGNVKAFEIIRDTIGEKPTENIKAELTHRKLEDLL